MNKNGKKIKSRKENEDLEGNEFHKKQKNTEIMKEETNEKILAEVKLSSQNSNEGYNPYESYLNLKKVAEELGLAVFLKKEPHSNLREKSDVYLEYYQGENKLPMETAIGLKDGKAKTFVEKINLQTQTLTFDSLEGRSYTSDMEWQRQALKDSFNHIRIHHPINLESKIKSQKGETKNLSFTDKYITPRTREYKDFVKELENTTPERFYQDGERQFTEREQKYLAIYNFKNGIENIPKTITTEKKWEMDNEMEVEGTGMSFYMQHEKNKEKMENENIIIGGKISEIAGKTLTDKNYLSLFDKNTQNTINEYMRVTPNIQPVALSEDDKITISQQNQQQNMENKPLSTIMQEIKNFTAEEKTYLKENLLLHFGQNTYSPTIFRELSEISDESVKKVENFLNKFKDEYFTLLLEKGKIKSDDDLSIFDDLIDNILVHMEKNDEIRNEINPVYLSMIENKEKLQNKVSEKVESLIGIIANNKEDENLGHKTKIFNELSEEEKVFFKANAKDIAIESISEIQEGISEEEKQNIAQKFDAFFKQIEEKPKKTYEQEEVINYLKNQLMYLGFGQDEKLHQQLEKSVLESENNTKFHLAVPYDKVQEGNHAQFLINFHKSDKGGVYLNSFKGVLVVGETGEERTHSFGANKFTAKEAVNLLEGRAVKAQFTNKFTNELDDVFVQLKLKEEKNEFNNYQMKMFNKNFGINTKDIVDKSPLIFEGENAEKTKEMVIKSLEKGNIVSVKFKDENNKEMNGKAILNPQYKNINLYDEQMNRMNTNKPIKGLEMDNQQQKNNAREQSIRRTPH